MSREIYGVLIALTITVPPSLIGFFVLMQMTRLMKELRDAKVDAMVERRHIMDVLQEVRHVRTIEVLAPPTASAEVVQALQEVKCAVSIPGPPVGESNPATTAELAKIKISEDK